MLCADTRLTLANSAAVLSNSFLFIVLRSITISSNACYLAAHFVRSIVEHGAFSRRRMLEPQKPRSLQGASHTNRHRAYHLAAGPVERSKGAMSNHRFALRVKTVMSSTRSDHTGRCVIFVAGNIAANLRSSCRVFGTITIQRALTAHEKGAKRFRASSIAPRKD
jgi:hypothetical protein